MNDGCQHFARIPKLLHVFLSPVSAVPLSFRVGAGITALECDALNVHFYTKCIGTLIAIAQGGDNGG